MNRIAPAKEASSWTGADTTHPAVDVTPESPDDLVEIVRRTDAFPSPVRAIGHLHSTNPSFATNVLGTRQALGTLVRMRPGFGRVAVEESAAGVRVRVGAGVRMIDIRDALRAVGRELAVSPEIGNATAGSVACGGTKDSTLKPRSTRDQAQISSQVVEVKFVDANGNRIRVGADGAEVLQQNGDPLPPPSLRVFCSSYGLLGIVYEVTFKTIPLVPIETRYRWQPIAGGGRPRPEQIPDVAALLRGADGVEADTIDGFLQPYDGGMLVERRTVKPGAGITFDDRIRRAIRDWVWEWGASEATSAAAALAELKNDPARALRELLLTAVEAALASTEDNALRRALGHGHGHSAAIDTLRTALGMGAGAKILNTLVGLGKAVLGGGGDATPIRNALLQAFGHLPGPFFTALGGFVGFRSDSMIDFAPPTDRHTCFDFTFWAFPLRRWHEIVSGYIAFCDALLRETGFRPSLFTEVYLMGHDETSLLSPCPHETMFTLDTVHSGPRDSGWRHFNERYNVWAAQHEGRPLLNQTKCLESTPNVRADVLDRVFGDDWAKFSAVVWRANPPLAGAADGRFVNDYFRRLLHPRP